MQFTVGLGRLCIQIAHQSHVGVANVQRVGTQCWPCAGLPHSWPQQLGVGVGSLHPASTLERRFLGVSEDSHSKFASKRDLES